MISGGVESVDGLKQYYHKRACDACKNRTGRSVNARDRYNMRACAVDLRIDAETTERRAYTP